MQQLAGFYVSADGCEYWPQAARLVGTQRNQRRKRADAAVLGTERPATWAGALARPAGSTNLQSP